MSSLTTIINLLRSESNGMLEGGGFYVEREVVRLMMMEGGFLLKMDVSVRV